MAQPTVTILLVTDVEKDPILTRYFFDSLEQFNSDALDSIQVIGLSQRRHDPMLEKCVNDYPGDAEMHYCDNPFVAGHPVWDVMKAARDVWPRVKGTYVTWAHPEFWHAPDRLGRVVASLKRNRPVVALGNLRRPGNDRKQWSGSFYAKDVSAALTTWLAERDWKMARVVAALMPTYHWLYWVPPPLLKDDRWREDVFFASKRFLEASGFMRDAGPMPFQDVYDLMDIGARTWGKYKMGKRTPLKPKCLRLNRHVHEAIHLWHEKHWLHYTPAMRDWFLERRNDPEYKDMRLVRADLWESMAHAPVTSKLVVNMKTGPGGTKTRFAVSLSEHMQNGGADTLRQFYKEWKDGS